MQESLTPFSLRRGPPFSAAIAERLFLCLPGGDALLHELDRVFQRLPREEQLTEQLEYLVTLRREQCFLEGLQLARIS